MPPVEDLVMPRTKRGPGMTQEDPLLKEEKGPLPGDRAGPAKGIQLLPKTILYCLMPLAFRRGSPIPLPTLP